MTDWSEPIAGTEHRGVPALTLVCSILALLVMAGASLFIAAEWTSRIAAAFLSYGFSTQD